MYLLMVIGAKSVCLSKCPSEWLRTRLTLGPLLLQRELVWTNPLLPLVLVLANTLGTSSSVATATISFSSAGSRKLRYVEDNKLWFCFRFLKFPVTSNDLLLGGNGGGPKQIVAIFAHSLIVLQSRLRNSEVYIAPYSNFGKYRFIRI